MTLKYYAGDRITGTASDRSGLTTTNILAGTSFLETDTNDLYHWDGSSWDVIASNTIAQTVSNRTLTTPTIAATGWANATHTHSAANRGGQFAISNTTGTLAVGRGGTGATSLNDLITLSTHTTGNYVAAVAGTANEIEISGSGSEGATVTIGIPTNPTLGGNVTISGNLTVSGSETVVSSTVITVADPIISLATTNTGNAVDIGFYGKYVSSGTKYTGLLWDANVAKYRLFHGNATEPTTTVDIADSGHTASTLIANLEGNVTGNITGTAPAGTLTGNTLASGVTASSLTSVGTLTDLTVSGTSTTIGTVTSGVWNAGAVTSSGAVTGTSLVAGNLTVTTSEIDVSSGDLTIDVAGSDVLLSAAYITPDDGYGIRWSSDVYIYGSSANAAEYIRMDVPAKSGAFYINRTGTVGIANTGVKTWQSGFDAIQLSALGSFNVDGTSAGSGFYMSNNIYRDEGNDRWEYIIADQASQYVQYDGIHSWRTAAAGSADAAISFSTVMHILANGSVGIGGTTTPTGTLHIERNDSTTYDEANMHLHLRNSGAGDTMIGFYAGDGWGIGIDNSDDDKFKLARHSNNLTTRTYMTVDGSGRFGFNDTTPTARINIFGVSAVNENALYVAHDGSAASSTEARTIVKFEHVAKCASTTTSGEMTTVQIRTAPNTSTGLDLTGEVIGLKMDFPWTSASGGVIGSGYNIKLNAPTNSSSGTMTNFYQLYIGDANAANATNEYGIYQAGTSDKNYFGGNVGIGTTSPTTLSNTNLNVVGATTSEVHIQTTGATSYPILRFKNVDGSSNAGHWAMSVRGNDSNKLRIFDEGTQKGILISTDGSTVFNGDMTITGTTPTLTIGDAGAEDATLVFDGNAVDYHIGLDDDIGGGVGDALRIGVGNALGTTPLITLYATGKGYGYIGGFGGVHTSSGASDTATGFSFFPEITAHSGDTVSLSYMKMQGGSLTAAATTGMVSTLHLAEPNIITGGQTITEAATLYIDSNPTEGSDNYAIYTKSGTNKFGSTSQGNNPALIVQGDQSAILHKKGDGVSVALVGIRSDIGGTGNFSFHGYNNANWIFNNGKVGIGTTTPDYPFEVEAENVGGWVSVINNTDTDNNPSGLLVKINDADSTGLNFGVWNGAYRFVVNGVGDVGIGTDGPYHINNYTFLHVHHATNGGGMIMSDNSNRRAAIYNGDANLYIDVTSTGYIDFRFNGTAPGGTVEFRMEADGDFHADGDVYAFSTTVGSDIALKENINVIPNALDKVSQLKGVSFDWKRKDKGSSVGLIAQDVEKVFPELVKKTTALGGNDSHKNLNYNGIIGLLVESIKELKDKIKDLENGNYR